MRAADYLGPTGPLARAIPGYEYRPSQLEMAEAVQQVLEGEGVVLVEAGTGTGKTLAYLLPALLSGRRVVISTGTRTLQDQIMDNDLPLLERHLGVPVNAACMKGLSNYLCLRRTEELERSAEADRSPLARELPVVREWRTRTLTGDIAELEELPEDAAIWPHVVSGSDTRIGKKCPHHDACFVTAMRRRAEEAQLVVVNHHLFFADLATRGPHGGGILPDYDAVVFDEAHQIEDVATQFFGVTLSTGRLERLARDAGRALAAARVTDGVGRLLDNVLDAGSLFFGLLPRSPEVGRVELAPDAFQGSLESAMLRFDDALDALWARCRGEVSAGEAVAQVAKRAGQLRDDLATVVEGSRGTRVVWSQTRGRRVSVGSSPVDVSQLLRESLFYQTPSVVLTSATLSTGGSFSFIERRLGIDFEARSLALPSPFDYPSQAALYLPTHVPDPRDARFLGVATDEVVSLVRTTGGGAFVLCTSFRVMRELAQRCRPHLDGLVLVQGEAPKGALLDAFRRAGDAVLFATASFWEGVDVPGRALRLVIIDKLPFDVPTDPLVAARCARLTEQGEAPFMRYLVPSAALALKQGFGRLVRGKEDRGVVAILDSRITKKAYGKVFLASLPDASRCYTMDEVQAFWRLLREEGAA